MLGQRRNFNLGLITIKKIKYSMKKFDDFEQSIKNTFDGHDQIKPSKSLWVRISSNLLLLALRRNLHIQGVIIAIIGIVGISTAIISNSNNDSGISQKMMSKYESINSIDSNSIVFYKNENINKYEIRNATISRTFGKYKEGVVNSNIENKDDNNENENAVAKSTVLLNYTGYIEPDKHEVNSGNEFSINTKDIVKNKKHAVYISSLSVNANRVNNKNNIENDGFNSNESNINTNTVKVGNKDSSSNLFDESIIIQEKTNVDMNNVDIMTMPLLGIKVNNNSRNIINSAMYRYINYRNNVIKYNYEIYGGFQVNISMIDIYSNNLNYSQESDKSILYDYNFGGNINLYRGNLFVRLGLNYNKYSEQYLYNTNSILVDSMVYHYTVVHSSYIQTITGWNTNVSGGVDSIPIYSQTVVETNENKSITEYDSITKTNLNQYTNDYSIVNIPLMIGYEFDFESYELDVSAGISWSHIVKSNSYLLNTKNGEMISINEQNTLMNTDIFNAVISIGAGYKLGLNNTIFVRPELYYNLNSIFDKKYIEKHKMYQLRFSLGLRYTIR